jgi:hypothetical protein
MRISVYTIPGPDNWDPISKTSFMGGWKYSISSIKLLTSQNPNVYFEIIVGHLSDFGIIPEIPEIPNVKFVIYEVLKSDLDVIYKNHQSSQHGGLLNYLINKHPASTDYFFIMDPDFYIMKKNVILDLVDHMDKFNLKTIGVSYPSNWPMNYYWDFPTVYFQIFRSSAVKISELDFRPDEKSFVRDKSQRSGMGMPRHKMQKPINFINFYMNKCFVFLNFKRAVKFCDLLSRLFNNKILPSRLNMARDTGWLNRERMLNCNIEIIPHAVIASHYSNSFDEKEYFKLNIDIVKSRVNAYWHFINFGLFEGREIGHQRIYWRLLSKLFFHKTGKNCMHPGTSIFSTGLDFSLQEIDQSNKIAEEAFFYFWRNELFGLHLGHEAKTKDDSDLNFISHLSHLYT